MGLERWNQDRPDAPEEFRNHKQATEAEVAPATEEDVKTEEPKKKRGRPKKSETEE